MKIREDWKKKKETDRENNKKKKKHLATAINNDLFVSCLNFI